MPRRRANSAVVEILEQMLAAARQGDLNAIWAVYRIGDDLYDSTYQTDDLDDMLVQVRTEVINTQTALSALHEAARPN